MSDRPPAGWARLRLETGRAALLVRVLARYGFAELSDRLGLDSLVRLRDRLLRRRRSHRELVELEPPERLARALVELGPTFVKFGQLLSTRPDLLPDDYLASLATLQDRVPGMEFEQLQSVVRTELGAAPGEVFTRFDAEPVAAASLAQVHRAMLAGAGPVAVKVQRPGVEDQVEGDLGLIERVTGLAERLPEYAEYDLRGLYEEFARTIRHELDYEREGRNCDACRRNFSGDDNVFIPRVHWSRTTRRVLVQDFIAGVKVTDTANLDRRGFDRHELARRGCRAYLAMVFEHGFFQADPHPGNLIVTPDGRIGIVDYGMFSRVDDETRDGLAELLLATWRRQPDQVVRVIDRRSPLEDRSARAGLRADVADLIDRYHGVELERIRFEPLAREFLTALRQHRIRLPRGMANLLRGLATVEGTGLMLDPEFNFVATMRPYLEKLAWRRFGPVAWLRGLGRSGHDLEALLRHLPGDLRDIITLVRRGTIRLKLDRGEFSDIAGRVERSNSRLSGAIVLAAIIVGASLLVFAAPGDLGGYVPAIGIAAFVAAGAIGLWLLVSIIRGTR
ncbi:AarF/ABC1/UbiB kinase family protein [candidate division WOR-3 bacterium]|nr:AarF/ABC1/UbiB kinase family protein [candidate division WOR-3 bacterium]